MSERKRLPTTQRVDPPQYLAKYLEKQNRAPDTDASQSISYVCEER